MKHVAWCCFNNKSELFFVGFVTIDNKNIQSPLEEHKDVISYNNMRYTRREYDLIIIIFQILANINIIVLPVCHSTPMREIGACFEYEHLREWIVKSN